MCMFSVMCMFILFFKKRKNIYVYVTLFKCHLQNNNSKCDINVKVFIIYEKNNVIDNYSSY